MENAGILKKYKNCKNSNAKPVKYCKDKGHGKT